MLKEHASPAVVMQNHGVFAVGASAEEAIKAAVMCEDVAHFVPRHTPWGASAHRPRGYRQAPPTLQPPVRPIVAV